MRLQADCAVRRLRGIHLRHPSRVRDVPRAAALLPRLLQPREAPELVRITLVLEQEPESESASEGATGFT